MKRLFAATKKNDALELLIYDAIGGGYFSEGITAKSVKQKLDAAGDVSRIVVRINSPGGSVFEGVAIYNLLTQHGAAIEVYVDGLAASIASVIAMAGAQIHMGEGSMLMIHNAWTIALGDAKEMRKTAELLDKISETSIRGAYETRTKKDAKELQEMMDAETWLSAHEAVDHGFADAVIVREESDKKAALALAAQFDLAAFAKTPEHFKQAAAAATTTDAPPNTPKTTPVSILKRKLDLASREA